MTIQQLRLRLSLTARQRAILLNLAETKGFKTNVSRGSWTYREREAALAYAVDQIVTAATIQNTGEKYNVDH